MFHGWQFESFGHIVIIYIFLSSALETFWHKQSKLALFCPRCTHQLPSFLTRFRYGSLFISWIVHGFLCPLLLLISLNVAPSAPMIYLSVSFFFSLYFLNSTIPLSFNFHPYFLSDVILSSPFLNRKYNTISDQSSIACSCYDAYFYNPFYAQPLWYAHFHW